VFGFGSGSGLSPWTDPSVLFRRNPGSGTQAMIAAAIGVKVDQFRGVDTGGSGAMVMKVTGSTSPKATLGILADTDVTDTLTLSLRVLAYQHYGQSCGYLPDSRPMAKDKRNVRDGHYALWGQLHLFTSNPPKTDAQRVISYITGTAEPPGGIDLIHVEAVNNLVPPCAMKVTRMTEMGPYVKPPPTLESCGCEFEATATGTTDCTPCTTATNCTADHPTCSHGYCE
jgi:hypothetical protein